MKFDFFRFILLVFLIAVAPAAFSQANSDSLLYVLSETIDNKESYIKAKKERINQLKEVIGKDNLSLTEKFNLYNKLHNEYATFKYDSAFTYATKLQQIARQLNDSSKITHAKLRLSFTLLSSGMFKETLDSLNTVKLTQEPDSIKIDYYALKARAFYDLASYNMDQHYSDQYTERGNTYLDSALSLSNENSPRYYFLRGMQHHNQNELKKAETDFQVLLQKFELSDHEYAIATSSLANIYYETGNTEKAIEMMAKAAIADIRSSTTEAIALMKLAELLYNAGDEALAYDYIKRALEDADFYGAKQRKIQVAAILPVIEGERLATVEEQRSRLLTYFIAMTVLAVLVVIFAFIIFRQLRQLREAKRTVTEAYDKLQETNEKLIEANLIKEEYIGYSFNLYSDYLDKIEKFKKSIDKKLMARKFDEISHVMKSVNLKKEREALYQSFDRIFLKLFPNFVAAFNAYFKDEDKIILKDNQTLNIELRIFALIRIGIHDHEQIARILEYSVSTIYNYKTRVRNRSILPNEEFEKRIMEIKAF